LERVDKGVELRALSPIVHQISALAESPQSSVESITRAIKQDPAICVKILKVANSAVYAGSPPVENVHKAVMRIGLGQIRQAVGSLAVVDRFGETALGQRISAQEFWEHSIACGLLASAIAKARGLRDEEADSCFTAGLLHDVGRVICAGELGEQYAAVLREADRLALPLELLETRMLGAGHAEIAERVLRAWKFPAHLVTPIALHHLSLGTLRSTAPRAVAEAATLSLANRLAHCLMLGQSGNDTVHAGRDMAAALSLTPETIARICAAVPEQTADLKLALLARGGGSVDRKEPEWMGLLPPKKDLRLAYLSTQPVLDGLGLLCRRLGPRQDQEAPTAAVVYLANVKEQEPLIAELGALEHEHGVRGVPVVVLSAGGNLPLDPRLGQERPCVQLPTPVHLRRLAAALGEVLGAGGGQMDPATGA
ncbi:MAG TPA: HDOD domain-containing protein, partial [Trebonia sp.]